jgi:nitrite reductase (cytochrome c-552)
MRFPPFFKSKYFQWLVLVLSIAASAGFTALLMNIAERKREVHVARERVQEVTEDTTDPALWGRNWPRQYDAYQRTALTTRTTFGGHGGSEALPEQKIERDPWIKRMFQGYAFALDYRDRRGHAYMLEDQEQTARQSRPQSGSCLHCHASVMPLYRLLGNGDAMAGFVESHKWAYKDLSAKLHETGNAHPVSCVDCHDPTSMALRVTRPGFILGIQSLARSEAPTPWAPSIEQWREAGRQGEYDPNTDASRNEMRSYVCGQCHVEYYCSTAMPLEFPWSQGLRADNLYDHWSARQFPDGAPFKDYTHAETGALIYKAQHPEFELWSEGVHARAGVACADCHMPYQREGATKVSDHWVRSPLLNVNRACQTCHNTSETEMLSRVSNIQTRNHGLLERGGVAIVALIDAINAAKAAGATDEQLARARELQRLAQWRLDFISSENSMGFHAPQEAARVLGEALDYARQGELAARLWSIPGFPAVDAVTPQ